MFIHRLFSPLCLFVLFSRSEAYFGYGLLRCLFSSPDDVVYLGQIYFNKVLLGEFNSTVGKYVGFTKKTQEIAEDLNKNPAFLADERRNLKKCETHVQVAYGLLKQVEPTVWVRSVTAASSKHPAMLICSAHNFYPKQIRLTWLRNGQEVTSDVSSTEELSNGNWLYQIHSYLEFTPRPPEKITCMVEHVSLMEPKFYDWDPRPESERNKIIIGAAGLLLGMVVLGAGLIYRRRSPAGRMSVPTSSM